MNVSLSELARAAIFGIFVGVAGTFLHDAYRPAGVIVSLSALVFGTILIRHMFNSRVSTFAFALGWVGVIIRASTLGNGGELLIQANITGNLFAFGGALFLVVALLALRYDD